MLTKRLLDITILFLLVITTSISFAQVSSEQQTITIAEISVEGNIFADANSIIAISGLKVGEKIALSNDTKIQNAIKNIWKRRQFSDIEIFIDKITPAGAFITIKVKEYPRINEIKISGNSKISDNEIKKTIQKMQGNIVNDYDLQLISRSIKTLYQQEGLLFAKVDTKLEPTTRPYFSDLIIEIDEGLEFRVRSISFIGNNNFSDSKLASSFEETKTKVWWQFWKSNKFDINKFKEDLNLLKKFYRKEGFIDAQVIKDSIFYDEKEKKVDIIVEVDEGTRTYIRNIVFRGNISFPTELLERRLGLKTGEYFNAVLFEENLNGNQEQSDVSSVYLDNGFLFKRIEVEEYRIPPDSIDLIIKIYEGERVRIRKVDIVGNTKTKDKVIRRELFTRPGDYFNKSAIIRSIRALGVMQYFNPEALKPDVKPVPTDNTKVDLVYNVEERSTDTFNASIGFAGIYGLTGAIGMTFNNFSITEPLKGGAGQILNFTWEFGTITNLRRFILGFTEPWLFDEPTTVGFNLYDSRHNAFQFDFRSTGGQVNIGRRFAWPDDYFRGDWSMRIQENFVGADNASWYRKGLTNEVTIGQTLSRISLNSLFFPTVGSRFSLSTYYAMGSVGLGNTDFLKNELNFELYNPLLKIGDYERVVLYLGAKIGYITGIKNDTTINPIELYYMGGSGLAAGFGITPLRGYQDRSIGPRDGGKVLSKYTSELRFALSVDPMPIYTYIFAEAGNVWSDLPQTDPFDLKRSFGIGLQLMINPIGIIGFSYGYGVDTDRTGERSGWRFLFHLGQ